MKKRNTTNINPGSNAWTLNSTITSWEAAISAFQGVIRENEALKKSEEILKREIERLNTELKKTYKELTKCNTVCISISSENKLLKGVIDENKALKKTEEILKLAVGKWEEEAGQWQHAYTSAVEENRRLQGIVNRIHTMINDGWEE